MMRSRVAALFVCALAALVAAEPLLLTPLVNAGKTQEARSLSAIEGDVKGLGYSAFFTVPSTSGEQLNNIFFWHMPCQNGCDPAKTPFILWFQGGPGGPGTFGAMSELGNWYLDDKLQLNERCFSWCREYNCLFVDQPVMTGFSFPVNKSTGKFDPDHIEYTKTSAEALEQIYQVLTQFFTVFPEYVPAPLYITGESYGGLYTAHMAYAIVNHNKASPPMHINLVGLAVGDPIINQAYQWPTYPDTLYGMGVIMTDEREYLRGIFETGVKALNAGDCPAAFKAWNSVWNDNGGGGAPGLFWNFTGSGMTENVLLGSPPEAFDYFGKFFMQDKIKKQFHYEGSPSGSFAEGGEVYAAMVNSGDFCSNSSFIYAKLLLEAKIDVMIYSSTADPLLGPPTTEAGVAATFDYAESSLNGGGAAKKAYNSAKKDIWKVAKHDSNVAGYAKCTGMPGQNNRFCYTVVRNAGHEAPAFQPRANYDMIKRFIEKRPFDASGDKAVPQCAQCGGVPPFAGSALPECQKN